MRKNFLITPIAMILVSGGISLSAQDFTTGTLAGRVTGPDGQGLQGVTVTLNSPSLLQPRQFTTDANGQFRAQMLVGGNYTVTYTLNGYLTRRLTTYVTPGQTIRGDMQLKPLEVQTETVEIAATVSSQQVDKTDTIVQSSFSQQKLLELTGGTSASSLVALIPGARTDGNDFNIRGGTTRGTKMLVDGSNITNMAEGTGYAVVYPMADAIESISIIQSPLNARYGNTDGGLVSFVRNKGSNDFKGALRIDAGRGSVWNASNLGYPNNHGVKSTFNPGNDLLSKNYQFYLSGPLWKDHITFSWSGQYYPTERRSSYQYESTGSIWVSGNGSAIDKSRYRLGTYYQNPTTGEVIRKAEMLEATDPLNTIPGSWVDRQDSFTLFYQITQNHQIEWSYMERKNNGYNWDIGYGMADMNVNPTLATDGYQRTWNLAYKGIIGSHGLLEARFASSVLAWFNVQSDGRPKYSVNVRTLPSLNPINPDGSLTDPNNYYASGLIDGLLNRQDGIKNSELGGTGSYSFNATNQGPGDSGTNEPINVNYQHILETSRGQHIIDVGFQRERSGWTNPNLYNAGNVNSERMIYSPGRIAMDLQTSDIFGYAGTPVSQYAGKFIVYNMNYATFNSVDPYGFSRFNTGGRTNEPDDGNEPLIAYRNGEGYGKGSIWPMMYDQYGSNFAGIYVQQMSYYLNDLWTINDHHSVMGGVRFDQYKVWDGDSGRDIYSYSLPTFRFDYKWDISGDQKRVVNVSWGQFHNMAPVSSWAAFVSKGIRERIWIGPAGHEDGKPYLVDYDDIMNPDNYRVISDNLSGGVNKVANDYKGLVTTEFTLGIRLNLDNGGSLRAAFINRSIANDSAYFYNGWVDNPNGDGTKVFSRILDNIDVERSYKSLELEWTIPVTNRVDFGGSYTYSRQMENASVGDSNSPQKSASKSVYYWKEYNEQFEYPYWGWNPVILKQPEHRFNGYINYDLTYGKVKSNAALRFAYTSASPATRSFGYTMGYPVIDGIYINNAGNPAPGRPESMPSNTAAGYTRTVYYNIHRTSGPDSWSTNLIYNVELPVTHKVRWFATITASNPFNHRGKGTGWYSIDGWVNSGNIVPKTIYDQNGNVVSWGNQNNPYDAGGMKSDNVQRSSAGLFAPNQVQGRRTIGLQTGLRF